MNIKYFQKGFNYSQDGPGNRLIIHLQGCNLHCPWCSNPEGMTLNAGKLVDVQEIVDEIIRSKRLFFDGGGVTFTGGECTLQKDALLYILKACKESGIHTTIETNGTFHFNLDFFNYVDLIISDFKHYDENKLSNAVGKISNYKKNVSDYINSGKKVLIRTVLINGFNAENNDAENFAKFFYPLNTNNTTFEFLPYHEYGKSKWEKLGKEYKMSNAFISNKTLTFFEETFKKYHLKTTRS